MEHHDRAEEELYDLFTRTEDAGAFEELASRMREPAFRVARCLCRNDSLAEESVQEAFIKMAMKKNSFQARGAGSFKIWFLSVVTNSAKMAVRSEHRAERKKRKVAAEPSVQCFHDSSDSSDVRKTEMRAALEQALDGLDEYLRMPLLLHYVEGLQQNEVATVLKTSPQMVSRRIQNGLDRLRARLEQGGVSLSVGVLCGALAKGNIFIPPARLAQRLVEMTRNPKAFAQTVSVAARSARAGTGAWTFPLLAAVAASIVGAVVWFLWAQSPEVMPPEAKVKAGYRRFYDFNDGLPAEFAPAGESCEWVKDNVINGTGGAFFRHEGGGRVPALRLPIDAPDKCSVEFDCRFVSLPAFLSGVWMNPAAADGLPDECWFYQTQTVDGANITQGPVRLELFFSRSEGFVGTAWNGVPFFQRTYDVKDIEAIPNATRVVLLSNAVIDNLTVSEAGAELEERWRRWRAEQSVFQAVYSFDLPTFDGLSVLKKSALIDYDLVGDYELVVAQGVNGSGALLNKGAVPLNISLSPAQRKGEATGQCLRFDWRPLAPAALRPAALNVFWIKTKTKDKKLAVSEAMASPAPNRLHRLFLNLPEASINKEALDQWHEVVLLLGARTRCFVDGKLFAVWDDPHESAGIGGLIVRIQGCCLIDNLQLTQGIANAEEEQTMLKKYRLTPDKVFHALP
jgi:RNA polymerase sigma factor (sigma-70 family)